MSVIAYIIFVLIGLLWLIGGIIFFIEMLGCEDGYEDETGFHIGKDPRR
jgi:hypothetical protein